jgi:hypothetical protein
MKTKIFIKVIFLFLINLNSYATEQIPDKIIINGEKKSLHSNPMEKFFESNPEKKPKTNTMSTALWRGYVATFEVIENQLYVIDIEILESSLKLKSVMAEVFPNQQKVKLDWFTGLLVIPFGEMINYVHMGYGSTYEFYTLLEIESGNLKKERNYNYKEYKVFKEKQFIEFKQTEKYKDLKKTLSENNQDDKLLDSFMKELVVEYTSKILEDSDIKIPIEKKVILLSLVGIWQGSEKDNQVNGMEKKWTMDRKENGTYVIKFETKINGKKNISTEYGTWWTEGDKFFEYHEDSELTDEYTFEILNEKQVKFIMKSTDIDFNKPDYIFIDTKVKK